MKKFLPITVLISVLLAGHSRVALAQTPANPPQRWGSWLIGTALLPGSPENKWGGFAEVQARTDAVFWKYFYNELKAGISYDLDKTFTVMLAGGRYATSNYRALEDGPLNVEKRLWLQLVLNQYLDRLKIEHRYRIEQRWFAYRGDSSGTRQRLRYRLNAFLPLNNKTITDKTVFLSVYDEIFLNPDGPVFERNRVYGGAGYQFSKHVILQVGWVNQANYNLPVIQQGQFIPQITSAKNNVVVSVTYRIAHRKATSPTEHLPSQQD
ncbi:DUF2490 domain-containing protein [Hymenobacter cavernae]|uniref:DUF2490 domain-containing protein n=1 Tax=Hymenobacter cavernae TaxID=2044852 RepID=A0ABQ1USV2_9BACT|nr:DUF2490 domain-containing protein [Hymenobacter cavernae]GGF25985.1 hypothetical protein GCM10011383_41920 [Hymenobacter cavernae]